MNGRLLVVDDAPDIRLLVGTVLADAGFTVTLATGGEEALELLRLGPRLDAIVLDVQMPDIDGWAVLRTLQIWEPRRAERPPVLLCTVKAGDDDRRLAAELGADAFLTKPFRLDELVRTVSRLVRPRPRTPSGGGTG